MQHIEIYRRPGEFAAWPANYGLWAFGDEVLLIFLLGTLGESEQLHARDKTKPFVPMQARSLDRGRTWAMESFTGTLPGSGVLSGDEHVIDGLKAGPRIDPIRDLPGLDEAIDFTDPETIVLCARTDLDASSLSWFYVSRNRGKDWSGPFGFKGLDLAGLQARTDIVPLSKTSALFMLTVAKSNGNEGHVLAARTDDGGRTFKELGRLGFEPVGFQIMPSSLRLPDGAILSAVRCDNGKPRPERHHWIDLYRSDDEGRTWTLLAKPVPDSGFGGNPPNLVLLADGRLILVYGQRDTPSGMRYLTSTDKGATWSGEIILREDGRLSDIGYPKTVLLHDGSLLSAYYFVDAGGDERFIAATIFKP